MYAFPVIPATGFGMRTEIEGFVFPVVLNDRQKLSQFLKHRAS